MTIDVLKLQKILQDRRKDVEKKLERAKEDNTNTARIDEIDFTLDIIMKLAHDYAVRERESAYYTSGYLLEDERRVLERSKKEMEVNNG